MTQRQVTHVPGDLPLCAQAAHTPKHYLDGRARHAGGGHFLECAICDRRTARHFNLPEAILEWHRLVGTAAPRTAADTRVRAIRGGQPWT